MFVLPGTGIVVDVGRHHCALDAKETSQLAYSWLDSQEEVSAFFHSSWAESDRRERVAHNHLNSDLNLAARAPYSRTSTFLRLNDTFAIHNTTSAIAQSTNAYCSGSCSAKIPLESNPPNTAALFALPVRFLTLLTTTPNLTPVVQTEKDGGVGSVGSGGSGGPRGGSVVGVEERARSASRTKSATPGLPRVYAQKTTIKSPKKAPVPHEMEPSREKPAERTPRKRKVSYGCAAVAGSTC